VISLGNFAISFTSVSGGARGQQSFGSRATAEEIPTPLRNKEPVVLADQSNPHDSFANHLKILAPGLSTFDYAEGVFLQEYLGPREAGHIALVSGGEIYSLVTNQEYKRAFAGNMGIVAGAPLGGLVERDTEDKYGLCQGLNSSSQTMVPRGQLSWANPGDRSAAEKCLARHRVQHPHRCHLWSNDSSNAGQPAGNVVSDSPKSKTPAQVSAGIGVRLFGDLAGYGYPYVQVRGPHLPVEVTERLDCDLWWNEVTQNGDRILMSAGHRIADIIALARHSLKPGKGLCKYSQASQPRQLLSRRYWRTVCGHREMI
jgi:hypothetical protein